jgi:Raf kinase inhibitor-like YbhB/YbcL family protein
MNYNSSRRWLRHGLAAAMGLAGVMLGSVNAEEPPGSGGEERLDVTSTTFTDHGTLPLITVYNFVVNGLNACTADGSTGGDQSPQLSWTHVPHHTRSFVVILYDTTAAFTHWGMYNIAAHRRELPQNAGVATSSFGQQVNNDFALPGYDGPCPPAGVEPFAHHYVFTVYALDTELTLSASANFPANGETLYHALIHAGREGHILASGSIVGLFSATPD